ncbi:MAG: acyltransferase family protein [Reyranellales bacterium]
MPYPASRRAEFDWLRVVALGMLIVFHSAIGFGSWPWHVTDPHHSLLLDGFLDFLLRWRVSLVFIVSGAAVMLALGRRSPSAILRERLIRLAVPLLFGVLVIVPPQIYLERVQRGQFHGSFLDFLPQAFNGFYPDGNLSWNHLWFIPYVLVLTALALPLFHWARSPAARRRLDRLMRAMADRHLYWLLLVPLVLADIVLRGQSNDDHSFLGDLHGWMEFATLFVLGGILAEWPRVLAAVQRERYAALAAAVAAYGTLMMEWPSIGENPAALPAAESIAWACASAINQLAWVLAFVGFLTRHLNRGSPLLAYATEAALPVYILHQSLIVFAVYHLHHVNWPLGTKIFLTLSFTLAGSAALYEIVIRRSTWLRLLFGVKPRARAIGPEVLVPDGRPSPGVTNRSRVPFS